MSMQFSLVKTLMFSVIVLSSTNLRAASCDEFSPSFLVDGVNQWQGMSVSTIVQRENNLESLTDKQLKKQTISLVQLIKPHSQTGTLTITACGDKSQTIDVADLFTNASDKSALFLSVSNKKFFKLAAKNNSKPLLKKVSQLKITK